MFYFVGELFGGPATSEEKIKEFEEGLSKFLSCYPDAAKTGYLVGNELTLADLAFIHRMTIPRAAGYKFEKYPAVSAIAKKCHQKDWFMKVNEKINEMIKAKN